MTSSLTVTFTGKTTVLQSQFLPEIILDADFEYSCALLDLFIKNKKENNGEMKKIIDLNLIRIECDIISGSYINGARSHIIHQFATSASHVKGSTFAEIPAHLNYFPVKIKNLRGINISIRDLEGKPIDIGGGDIICRINIKRDCISEKRLT